jgi:hypothetical protein
MYLVMFPKNEITCYLWIFLIYVRRFTVRGFWLILFWLFWDILGTLKWGSSGVAHFAHLGGFAAGVGLGVLYCKKGWCLLDEYDESLVQMWQNRKKAKPAKSFDPAPVSPGRSVAEMQPQPEVPADPLPSIPMLDLASGKPVPAAPPAPSCTCGRKIVVSSQYAGKVVRCPHCRAPVQIPPVPPRREAPPPPSIRFVCPCGQKIKVPARYAGRTGKCPQCGARLRIPSGRR